MSTKTQEEQERELMLLNAQLDKQISAVEQQADSVLQEQEYRASSTTHSSLVDNDGDTTTQRPGTHDHSEQAPDSLPRSNQRGVGMSPRVKRAVRASASRGGHAIPAASTNDSAAQDKRNLNQQNQLRVQKIEIAQLKKEVEMMKEEVVRLTKERKTAQAQQAAATTSANEMKRILAKTKKELEDSHALCQKVRAKNKELDVQVSHNMYLVLEI